MRRVVIKNYLYKLIGVWAIAFAVWGIWAGLEIIYYGEVEPRVVDNWIGFLLLTSLYKNYSSVIDKYIK